MLIWPSVKMCMTPSYKWIPRGNEDVRKTHERIWAHTVQIDGTSTQHRRAYKRVQQS